MGIRRLAAALAIMGLAVACATSPKETVPESLREGVKFEKSYTAMFEAAAPAARTALKMSGVLISNELKEINSLALDGSKGDVRVHISMLRFAAMRAGLRETVTVAFWASSGKGMKGCCDKEAEDLLLMVKGAFEEAMGTHAHVR